MSAIRKLETDDFKHLLIIETECFDSGYSPYFIKMIPILFSTTSFIALQGRSPLGYIASAIEQGNSRRAWIMSLAVRPRYRGTGIGEELMEQALTALAKANVREVCLTAAADNSAALSLYEKLGFSTVKTINDFYGPGEHRKMLNKLLTD